MLELSNTGWEVMEHNGIRSIDIGNKENKALPVDNTGKIILANDLPRTLREGATISFTSYHQNVEVIVDGKVIYKYGSKENTNFSKLSGCTINVFKIPKQYAGKKMQIFLTNTYDSKEGFVPEFYIGTEMAQIKHILKEWWFGIVLTIAIGILGIIQIFQWIATGLKRRDISKLYLGLCDINLAI